MGKALSVQPWNLEFGSLAPTEKTSGMVRQHKPVAEVPSGRSWGFSGLLV